MLDVNNEFRACASLISLEILAGDEDMSTYLDGRMPELVPFMLERQDLQEEIKGIIGAVDGMFLLAQLYFNSLRDKTSPREIKNTLADFGTRTNRGSKEQMKFEALAEAYQHAMERIAGQLPGFQTLAKKILSWISHAKRPLVVLELRHALAVVIGDRELDHDRIPDLSTLLSVRAGLVTVDERSQVIRLVHYTAQGYLKKQGTWFLEPESYITKACLTYLSFDNFESGICYTADEFTERLRTNPLYDYAAMFWGDHVAEESETQQDVLQFLTGDSKVAASSQVLLTWPRYWDYCSEEGRIDPTGVHLAAWFGLTHIMEMLIQRGYQFDLHDTWARTPLSVAAERGCAKTVRLLAGLGADLEAVHRGAGFTPMLLAVQRNHEAVVRVLIELGANLEYQTHFGWKPLIEAVHNDNQTMVRLLVELGANLECQEKLGRTPLIAAVHNDNQTMVRLLVELGANLECQDYFGWKPLMAAIYNDNQTMVRLLVELGANLECQDRHGWTPLLYATCRKDPKMVRLLVELGANLEHRAKYLEIPLLMARQLGDQAMVRLLIDLGAADPGR
ncbi:Ankyrin repeat-containing protein [Cladophialophora immunda]|nr:Ankyrin repeat-containing protein [Cladophialophora immunda]